jgi:hypothetical protein
MKSVVINDRAINTCRGGVLTDGESEAMDT